MEGSLAGVLTSWPADPREGGCASSGPEVVGSGPQHFTRPQIFIKHLHVLGAQMEQGCRHALSLPTGGTFSRESPSLCLNFLSADP